MIRENRRHQRFPIIARAVMKIRYNNGFKQLTTLTQDISKFGIGLHAYKPLKKGTPASLELAFMSSMGTRKKDTIAGRIAWIAKEGKFYHMGVSFDEGIHPNKHPNLYQHFLDVIRKA